MADEKIASDFCVMLQIGCCARTAPLARPQDLGRSPTLLPPPSRMQWQVRSPHRDHWTIHTQGRLNLCASALQKPPDRPAKPGCTIHCIKKSVHLHPLMQGILCSLQGLRACRSVFKGLSGVCRMQIVLLHKMHQAQSKEPQSTVSVAQTCKGSSCLPRCLHWHMHACLLWNLQRRFHCCY